VVNSREDLLAVVVDGQYFRDARDSLSDSESMICGLVRVLQNLRAPKSRNWCTRVAAHSQGVLSGGEVEDQIAPVDLDRRHNVSFRDRCLYC
jgi:hypothetical protein